MWRCSLPYAHVFIEWWWIIEDELFLPRNSLKSLLFLFVFIFFLPQLLDSSLDYVGNLDSAKIGFAFTNIILAPKGFAHPEQLR